MAEPILYAALALAIAVATWTVYLARVKHRQTPARPIGSIALQTAAIASAAAAFVLGPTGAAPWALGGTAILLAGLFLFLLSQRKTPLGTISVRVGDRLPRFTTLTSEGVSFCSEDLSGTRFLLKFFRGSW